MVRLLMYQLRVSWKAIHWSACAISLLMPLFFNIPSAAIQDFGVMQAFWPVIGCFALGSLVSQEAEGRTHELLASHMATPMKGFFSLLMVGVISLLCCLGLTTLAATTRAEVRPGAVLLLLPGAFYLGSMALLVGTVTGNTMAGLLLPSGFWLFDVFTQGTHTGVFSCLAQSTADAVSLAALSLVLVGTTYLRFRNQSA